MLKVLFLVLIVMSFVVFGQKQAKPEAFKFFEFGKISNKLLKEKTEDFYKKLKEDLNSQGYIINYGSDKEIAKREKQLRATISFRDYDSPRITFVRGGNYQKQSTELWIVPADAKPPSPNSSKLKQ